MTKELLIENSGLVFKIDQISNKVKEAVDKTGLMILKGVPCSVLEEINGNGRKYSRKEMQKAIRSCKENKLFESRRLLCSANDHPTESFVPPASASHIVVDAYSREESGKVVFKNDWLVLNTESGKNLQALVEAGASFGTSIRGLGQINEDTSEVEQYEFLGTDAVGNPSASTYASNQNFKVSVESLNGSQANYVKKQLESDIMPAKIGSKFDLSEAIVQFKNKYFENDKAPETVSREVVSDLLALQMKAVDEGLDVAELEALSDEIFGETDQTNNNKKNKDNNQHQDRDVINRAQRELEATQNLAQHLKSEVEKLEQTKKDLEIEIKAYQKVSENLYVQVEEIQREADESKTDETKRIARKALSSINNIQKEAHDVITSMETRLENAIRIADTAVENGIVLRRICDSLYTRILKITDSSEGAFKSTRTKQATIESSALAREQGNKSSVGGNRTGWY
jgi:soluble cytochrome b562